MAGKKIFRNAVPACVVLRKSFRKGVPARYLTKIPLLRPMKDLWNENKFSSILFNVLNPS
jgi:hypothetical protein